MFTTILTIAPILSTGSNLILKKLQTEELGRLTLELEKQTKEVASIYSEVRAIQLEGFYLGMNKLHEITRPVISYDEFIGDINIAKEKHSYGVVVLKRHAMIRKKLKKVINLLLIY